MATKATETTHPGISVGPASEFSLFFRVKPGEGDTLRAALRRRWVGLSRPGDCESETLGCPRAGRSSTKSVGGRTGG